LTRPARGANVACETSTEEPQSNGRRRTYDAFISYSRTADGKLEPALQRGLQRFAEPWYRLRALRVFRDDASLSANPDLWGSITQALDESEYFVLLASPAPPSLRGWRRRPSTGWEHRGADRMLVVLTEGELFWVPGEGVDRTRTSALPEPLDDAVDEEPRYVDLRWARSDTQLGQRDARFRNAIADLAAPLHGRSKDEMLGDQRGRAACQNRRADRCRSPGARRRLRRLRRNPGRRPCRPHRRDVRPARHGRSAASEPPTRSQQRSSGFAAPQPASSSESHSPSTAATPPPKRFIPDRTILASDRFRIH
jgi:hypothetical protein